MFLLVNVGVLRHSIEPLLPMVLGDIIGEGLNYLLKIAILLPNHLLLVVDLFHMNHGLGELVRKVEELLIKDRQLLHLVDLLNAILRMLLFPICIELLRAHSAYNQWHVVLPLLPTCMQRYKYLM